MQQEIPHPPEAGIVNALRFGSDPFRFLEGMQARFEDIVSVPLPGRAPLVIVTNPELIHEALSRPAAFSRVPAQEPAALIANQGLVQSEGALWRQQRSIMGPAFRGKQVTAYANTVGEMVDELATEWRESGTRKTRNLHEEMTAMTIRVASDILLGEDIGRERAEQFHDLPGLRSSPVDVSVSQSQDQRERRSIHQSKVDQSVMYGCDSGFGILQTLTTNNNGLTTAEQEHNNRWIVHAVKQARELLRFVLDGLKTKPDRDRTKIQYIPQVASEHDVLNGDLRLRRHVEPEITNHGSDHLDRFDTVGNGLCTSDNDFSRPKHECGRVRLLYAKNQSGEVIWVIQRVIKLFGDGSKLKFDLESRRGDHVFDRKAVDRRWHRVSYLTIV